MQLAGRRMMTCSKCHGDGLRGSVKVACSCTLMACLLSRAYYRACGKDNMNMQT